MIKKMLLSSKEEYELLRNKKVYYYDETYASSLDIDRIWKIFRTSVLDRIQWNQEMLGEQVNRDIPERYQSILTTQSKAALEMNWVENLILYLLTYYEDVVKLDCIFKIYETWRYWEKQDLQIYYLDKIVKRIPELPYDFEVKLKFDDRIETSPFAAQLKVNIINNLKCMPFNTDSKASDYSRYGYDNMVNVMTLKLCPYEKYIWEQLTGPALVCKAFELGKKYNTVSKEKILEAVQKVGSINSVFLRLALLDIYIKKENHQEICEEDKALFDESGKILVNSINSAIDQIAIIFSILLQDTTDKRGLSEKVFDYLENIEIYKYNSSVTELFVGGDYANQDRLFYYNIQKKIILASSCPKTKISSFSSNLIQNNKYIILN